MHSIKTYIFVFAMLTAVAFSAPWNTFAEEDIVPEAPTTPTDANEKDDIFIDQSDTSQKSLLNALIAKGKKALDTAVNSIKAESKVRLISEATSQVLDNNVKRQQGKSLAKVVPRLLVKAGDTFKEFTEEIAPPFQKLSKLVKKAAHSCTSNVNSGRSYSVDNLLKPKVSFSGLKPKVSFQKISGKICKPDFDWTAIMNIMKDEVMPVGKKILKKFLGVEETASPAFDELAQEDKWKHKRDLWFLGPKCLGGLTNMAGKRDFSIGLSTAYTVSAALGVGLGASIELGYQIGCMKVDEEDQLGNDEYRLAFVGYWGGGFEVTGQPSVGVFAGQCGLTGAEVPGAFTPFPGNIFWNYLFVPYVWDRGFERSFGASLGIPPVEVSVSFGELLAWPPAQFPLKDYTIKRCVSKKIGRKSVKKCFSKTLRLPAQGCWSTLANAEPDENGKPKKKPCNGNPYHLPYVKWQVTGYRMGWCAGVGAGVGLLGPVDISVGIGTGRICTKFTSDEACFP